MRSNKIPTEIWALITGGFCIALGIGIVGPIIPQLADSYGVSITAASAIVSAFALMRIIAAPFASWFVKRTNERLSYITGLFFVAATTLACGFSNSYESLLAFRTISGIGSVLFTVAASTLVIKLSPAHMRGKILSYNAASFLLGALIGPAIGAAVAAISLQAPFFVYTVLLLIAGIFVAVSLGRINSEQSQGVVKAQQQPVSLQEAMRSRTFWAALYSAFTTGWAVWGVRISVVPLFVAALTAHNLAAPGWALTAYAAGNAALVIPSGRWNDKIGRKPLVLLGFAISALSYAALPFMSELAGVLIIMIFAGVGSALLNPAQNAAVADVIGNRNGASVISTHSMMLDLGSVIGPLLIGMVMDRAGFAVGFWITAALLASTVLVWFFAPESNPYAVAQQPHGGPQLQHSDSGEISTHTAALEIGPETGTIPIIRQSGQEYPESGSNPTRN